jgi:ribosomal protein L37E
MVMIRCPSCGQRTLDVASMCPKCGHVLLQNPLETSAGSELVSCRRCGKHISRQATVCPFCGHHLRRARRTAATAWAVFAVGVVGAAGWGVYRAGYLDWLVPPPDPASPAAISTAAVGEPDTTPPNAVPIMVPPPDTTPVQPPRSQTAETQPAPAGSIRTRWTTEWANVRQDRNIQSAVVRVLAPGVEVSVARLQDGWWEYYEDGAVRGYIANSVLAAQRG